MRRRLTVVIVELAIIIVLLICLVCMNSCITSKGLYPENANKNKMVKHEMKKETEQHYIL